MSAQPYPVHVGSGAVEALAEVVPERAKRVAVVTQENIGIEVRTGRDQQVFHIGDGETAKTMSTVEDLCRQFSRWGLTRADAVVGVGGGVVTDVAGFAAASYHRGLPVVHVATSLLGQVDAAIGGKCGVNIPEGKNLVGAFWQPRGVICDTDHLATLAPRERRSGMGEIAKYQFLTDRDSDVDIVALPLEEQVAACVQIKADVVASDEREGGRRAILNYGHTLAHALEIAGTFDLRHGEAVAIGVVYAGVLAGNLGRIDGERVEEHLRTVAALDLPTTLPADADPARLIELFASDKKALDGITFVLDGDRGVEPVTGIDPAVLEASMEALR